MSIVYLNGQYLPTHQAMISVHDHGFLYGDGLYDLLLVHDQTIFNLHQHLGRLKKQLQHIKIDFEQSDEAWHALFMQLLKKNPHLPTHKVLYIQITRGKLTGPRNQSTHPTSPTCFVEASPHIPHNMDRLSTGFLALTAPDMRHDYCNIKSISRLANSLSQQHQQHHNCFETLLIQNNLLTEGTTSNVFIVKRGGLYTPKLSSHVLDGVTRSIILTLAQQNQIPCYEQDITIDALYQADEIWVTGTSKEICPIKQIDEHIIGPGKAGPMWHKMYHWYQLHKTQQISPTIPINTLVHES